MDPSPDASAPSVPPDGCGVEELTRLTLALRSALRERDENTASHSSRTSGLALELGMACGVSAAELAVLVLAAELHDVGKIGIPDRILLKPGPLDAHETAAMRTHSRKGHDILVVIPDPQAQQVAGVVLHHHEASDGSGYPDGLAGEAVPPLARIIAVVDAYDAMASARPYHQPRSHREVMQVLLGHLAARFDHYVIERFQQVIGRSIYRAAT